MEYFAAGPMSRHQVACHPHLKGPCRSKSSCVFSDRQAALRYSPIRSWTT